jgi:hypothetical protein
MWPLSCRACRPKGRTKVTSGRGTQPRAFFVSFVTFCSVFGFVHDPASPKLRDESNRSQRRKRRRGNVRLRKSAPIMAMRIVILEDDKRRAEAMHDRLADPGSLPFAEPSSDMGQVERPYKGCRRAGFRTGLEKMLGRRPGLATKLNREGCEIGEAPVLVAHAVKCDRFGHVGSGA